LPSPKGNAALIPRPHPRIARARSRTAANLIYTALRDDIIFMRLSPGHPIDEKQLALDHGVSRTPVREALLRLASEHLVDIFPQSGTFVARIPLAVLPEAVMVRKALEDLTVRLAAKMATEADIARLRENLDEQKAFVRRGDRLGFHLTDREFHAIIADTADHPNIWRMVQQVKVQIDRYCMLTLPAPGRMKILIAEHAAILAGIATHDEARAGVAMATHLDWMNSSIYDIRGLNRDFFDVPPEWPGQ
jgi:DNA-binding GntR family transcriptional regulator